MELINIICNKDLIKEFLENKIVLNCKTKENAQKLLNYLAKNNYLIKNNCFSENEVIELINTWNTYKKDTCYQYENKSLFFDNKKYYRRKEKKEIRIWN